MTTTLARTVRWTAIAAGAIAYPVLAHYSTTTAAATATPTLGVVVSLAPSLALLFWLAWRSPRRLAMLLLCASAGVSLWALWGALERNFSWVYFLQHAGTNLMLAAVFGATLEKRRQPLCTRFAEAFHGPLAPEVVRYTRQVTLAWMLFFLSVSLVSAMLFFFSSIEVWSVFANFLTFPLVMLMFAVEYGVRLRKLPHMERHSIMAGILAFWKHQPASSGTPPHAR